MRILFIGDIVGRPGRQLLQEYLPRLINHFRIDFTVVNGENAAGGRGISQKAALALFDCGVDVITLGNHAWDNQDVFRFLDQDHRIVVPYNFPPAAPGNRLFIAQTPSGKPLVVAQLVGKVFMPPVYCPFLAVQELLNRLPESAVSILDFHAEATSEKIALGWFLAGKVTALVGTHTHIPTADPTILEGGTAYITDVGMTGAFNSCIGVKKEAVIHRFLTGLPANMDVAKDDVRLCAVVIEVAESSLKAVGIQQLFYKKSDLHLLLSSPQVKP